jgi:hypothetical protein
MILVLRQSGQRCPFGAAPAGPGLSAHSNALKNGGKESAWTCLHPEDGAWARRVDGVAAKKAAVAGLTK